MPLFRGFKFSLNLASGKQFSEFTEDASPVSIKGAYKLNTEEFFGVSTYAEPPKKITPSMVKLPPAFQPDPTDPNTIRATKSTSNLTDTTQPTNLPPTLRKSTPEVSLDPRGGKTNNRNSADDRKLKNKNEDKQQKRLEKKRQDEQKKREKMEAQERAKQEKIDKAREKAELKERIRQEKLRKEKQKAEAAKVSKKTKITPKSKPQANNPLAQGPSNPTAANPLARNPYNSSTLNSSISKTSGPPPYNEITDAKAIVQNERDNTGNTSFGKPIDEGSTWDMVAQHRAQVSRTPAKSRVQLLDNEPNVGRKSLDV